jgi:hypothetical protein
LRPTRGGKTSTCGSTGSNTCRIRCGLTGSCTSRRRSARIKAHLRRNL